MNEWGEVSGSLLGRRGRKGQIKGEICYRNTVRCGLGIRERENVQYIAKTKIPEILSKAQTLFRWHE